MKNRLRNIHCKCSTFLAFLVVLITSAKANAVELIISNSDTYSFSDRERTQIEALARRTEQEVRDLLPELPKMVQISVSPIDRDLTGVGGVTGRADDPTNIVVYVSTQFEGGVKSAIETGLRATLYHELHHLFRGWTMQQNDFGPGITIAAVNEGLANVFSEHYTNTAFEGNAYPSNVAEWYAEIRALPTTANYNHWMNQHPDGRLAIGYRTGSYIIHQAQANSGLSVLGLSSLTVEEILGLANNDS